MMSLVQGNPMVYFFKNRKYLRGPQQIVLIVYELKYIIYYIVKI